MLSKVRRAVNMADSIHTDDAAFAEQLLNAAGRCRDAQREFLELLDRVRPSSLAAEHAREELRKQISGMDCGEELLRQMFDNANAQTSEIHTETPPSQIQ